MGAATVVLISRKRSQEAYGLSLFLAVAGTVTSVIGHLNSGVPEQQAQPLPRPAPQPPPSQGHWT